MTAKKSPFDEALPIIQAIILDLAQRTTEGVTLSTAYRAVRQLHPYNYGYTVVSTHGAIERLVESGKIERIGYRDSDGMPIYGVVR